MSISTPDTVDPGRGTGDGAIVLLVQATGVVGRAAEPPSVAEIPRTHYAYMADDLAVWPSLLTGQGRTHPCLL